MNTTQFKQALEEEKARLEVNLESVGRRNPSNPADWEARPTNDEGSEADTLDEAQQNESFENNEAVLADLEVRYNQVIDALARIDAGTYGVCMVGNEPIEEDRLNADPAATTCKAHL